MDSQPIRTLCITGTSAEWATHNIILAKGELGYDSTNKALKVGDGITPFLSLPAASTWASGAILDNVDDGTSYKRIQAAKADALNASTIVAGTIWSSGNDGNGGTAPAPKFYSTLVLLAGNAYASVTLSGAFTYYLITAQNAGIPSYLIMSIAMVNHNDTGLIVGDILTDSGISITASGKDIRITNKASYDSYVNYNVFRLSY